MKDFDAYPSILKSKHGDCILQVHVDDLLIVGSRDAVVNKLIPSLQSKYEVSIEIWPRLVTKSRFSSERMSCWKMAG